MLTIKTMNLEGIAIEIDEDGVFLRWGSFERWMTLEDYNTLIAK